VYGFPSLLEMEVNLCPETLTKWKFGAKLPDLWVFAAACLILQICIKILQLHKIYKGSGNKKWLHILGDFGDTVNQPLWLQGLTDTLAFGFSEHNSVLAWVHLCVFFPEEHEEYPESFQIAVY
jgi:hypothetical protein